MGGMRSRAENVMKRIVAAVVTCALLITGMDLSCFTVTALADPILMSTGVRITVDAPVASSPLADSLTIAETSGENAPVSTEYEMIWKKGSETVDPSIPASDHTAYTAVITVHTVAGYIFTSADSFVINSTQVPSSEYSIQDEGQTIVFTHTFPATAGSSEDPRTAITGLNISLPELDLQGAFPEKNDFSITATNSGAPVSISSLEYYDSVSAGGNTLSKLYEKVYTKGSRVSVNEPEYGKRYWVRLTLTTDSGLYRFGDTVDTTVGFVKGSTASNIHPRIVLKQGESLPAQNAYYSIGDLPSGTKGYYYYLDFLYTETGYNVVSFSLDPLSQLDEVPQSIPEIAVILGDSISSSQLPVPSAKGWTFSGWKDETGEVFPPVTGSGDENDKSLRISRHKVLEALWNQASYHSIVDLDGGSVSDAAQNTINTIESSSYFYGNPSIRNEINAIRQLVAAKQWYTFKEWKVIGETTGTIFGSCNSTQNNVADDFSMPPENIVFKAVFVPIDYTIVYGPGTGLIKDESDRSAIEIWNKTETGFVNKADENITCEGESIVLPGEDDVISPEGKQLVGWKLNDSGEVITELTLDPGTQGYSLTAVWEEREYEVVWDFAGGEIRQEAADDAYLPVIPEGETVAHEKYEYTVKVPSERDLL